MGSNMAKPAANSYRYERKFLISELTREEVQALIKTHPAIFREIYHPRYVNNIYFDTVDMGSYFDNVNGAFDRAKVRIRWYGGLFGAIEKPVLEFKIKKGHLGAKINHPLCPFSLNKNLNSRVLAEVFEKSDIPLALKVQLLPLKPSLLNRYSRCYYLSAHSDFRVTIDDKMEFYSVNGYRNCYLHKYREFNKVVLELKYNQSKDRYVHNITKQFSFRMTKNSKYLNGIESLAF